MVAAEALDRDDRAVSEEADGLVERHREPGPADRAGDRLGVEAPVGRVLVLPAAVAAQRETCHRRVRPVVGDAPDDREARPALRAVDERVAVAAVRRVEELVQAVVAGRDVGRDEGRPPGRAARRDREPGFASRGERLDDDGIDPGKGRRLEAECGAERVELVPVAFGLYYDAFAVVQHEPAERVPPCDPVHERAEADALNDPSNAELAPLDAHLRRDDHD